RHRPGGPFATHRRRTRGHRRRPRRTRIPYTGIPAVPGGPGVLEPPLGGAAFVVRLHTRSPRPVTTATRQRPQRHPPTVAGGVGDQRTTHRTLRPLGGLSHTRTVVRRSTRRRRPASTVAHRLRPAPLPSPDRGHRHPRHPCPGSATTDDPWGRRRRPDRQPEPAPARQPRKPRQRPQGRRPQRGTPLPGRTGPQTGTGGRRGPGPTRHRRHRAPVRTGPTRPRGLRAVPAT